MEPVSDGELGPDPRDREAGRLRGERRGARHAGVHLDHQHLAGARMDRELDVAAPGLDADLSDDGDGGVSEVLVLHVRQGLSRGDGDRVPRVDAHRIHVLDGADDDDVVLAVADHLELELLPPDDRPVHEDLSDGGGIEAAADPTLELLAVVSDPAPRAPEGERGPDDRGIARVLDDLERLFDRLREASVRNGETDPGHRRRELLTVLGHLNGTLVGSDELYAVLREDPLLMELHRQGQRRLTTHRGQEGVWLLPLHDPRHPFARERLDVGAIGEPRVRHDRGGVRVHENDPIPLLLERSDGLRPRIVELAGLTDHDRAGAQDQDGL